MSSRSRGFTMVELMVVVAIIGITAAVAISGFKTNNTRTAARRIATLMATANRAAIEAGTTATVTDADCATTAKAGAYIKFASGRVDVFQYQSASSSWSATPYSSAPLPTDVEIYAIADYVKFPDTGSLCPASPTATTLPKCKLYNPDGTADGYVVYLDKINDDNTTRYCAIGMPLSPAPQVAQDW